MNLKRGNRGFTIIGALIVLVVILAIVGGMLYVAKRVIDRMNQLFPEDTALSYYYEGYDPSYFYTPNAVYTIPAPLAHYDGNGMEAETIYQMYWAEHPTDEFIPVYEFTCYPSQLEAILYQTARWDGESAREAEDWSRPGEVHVARTGYYYAELIRD